MIEQKKERIVAVYFEKMNVGVCLWNLELTRMQCSSLTYLCHIAYKPLFELCRGCSAVLTNAPMHQLFSELDRQATVLLPVSEKSYEYDIIEHHLSKLTSHIGSLKNPKAYFRKMAENRLKFHALGMLLQHLWSQSTERKLYLQDIDYFTDTLFQRVNYGKSQLQFLQIIKEDIHPSLIKGKGQSKEGYSILSAYESYLFSTGSKKILRYLFMNPTYRREVLEQRFEIIEWMKYYMKDTHKYSKFFRNVHFLETILKKFGRMNAEEEDWRKLLKTLETMIEMTAILKQESMPRIVKEYVEDYNWSELIEMFSIFKETFDFMPFCIKSGIDQTLDQLKQTYDNMPHILTLIAKEQEWDLEFRIVFITQVGYLIKIDKDVELPSEFDSEDWILQFSNNSGKFYSNELTQSLDREYGDTFGEIQDIEKKITFDMQALIVERQAVILDLYWKLCEIECFWGISQLSRNMCRPRLSSQSLIISNGWHLLLSGNAIHNHVFSFCQRQAPKHQVFNSQRNLVNMSYSNRCMIVTGPNASGKTVYMKQIGIIVYLAHLGFYIPASLAEIPLTDSIIFVGKSQSIYNGQECGFHSELASLSSITQPYILTNKSLVLIDELGQEIDYQNSLKLIYATVEFLTSHASFTKNRLLTRQQDEFNNPLVVIVTHLSEILNSKIIEESYRIRFLTMTVEEQGICLFKIKPGLVSKGYGLRAAAQIMPSSFISLSRRYLSFIESS